MLIKVNRIISTDIAYNNTIYHNKNDYEGKTIVYFNVKNISVYKSVHNATVEKKSVEMSGVLRRLFNITEGYPYAEIIPIEIQDQKVKILNIQISLNFVKKENINYLTSIHEEELKDVIREKFKNHYFYQRQQLIFKHAENEYLIEILNQPKGTLLDETKIEIISVDNDINIISSSLLKRDLFQQDYNFENIGIGGLDNNLKNIFKSALCTRAFSPKIIEKLNIKHVKGVLLYGPPGTGKTLIARKIGYMISPIEPKICNGPEILNKYVGQSEENLRNIFKDAQNDYELHKDKAKLHVIIFDEIDAICKKRGSNDSTGTNDKIVNTLLSIIDGVKAINNIFVIGMTNRIELLDDALLRAGRLEIKIRIGLPDKNGRHQIFRIYTDKMVKNNMMENNVDFDKLVNLTENYSGAEIESIVKRAVSFALYDIISSDKINYGEKDILVTQNHIEKAISDIQPGFGMATTKITSLLPQKYELYENQKKIKNNIMSKMQEEYELKTILIHGKEKSGKTTISCDIADSLKITYTKIIQPFDMISMDEYKKTDYITSIFYDSYQSKDSLIIIEDIDQCINFTSILGTCSYSSKILNVLMTLLKTKPENKNNKLTVIATNSSSTISTSIIDKFDCYYEL